MDNYKSLYYLLFNDITDMIDALDNLKGRLVKAQQRAEQHFIERDKMEKKELVTEYALKEILQIVKDINEKNELS
ncbi:MAG: hypothetical protein LBC82_04475 [Oscillospiraceae bacterium]|nr:hypothetical protein [Oscillospiraceae bacterium]